MSPQAFLVTGDAGKTWQVVNIPHVTLYSFFPLKGEYWAIGTEVVDRDRGDGGHAVPVALHSADGVKWIHLRNDLSACGPEMCVACEPQGCFSSNGTITNFFGQKTSYRTFPPVPNLTAKWAATDSQICFLGGDLECAALSSAKAPATGSYPEPVATSPGPLGTTSPAGPHCISCELDRILVDPKAQGFFTISLSLNVARDGTVSAVTANGAPTPQIKSRIEQQAQQWLFEPYVQNGVRVNLRLKTRIQISVIHPR